jgi:hypothetical protein
VLNPLLHFALLGLGVLSADLLPVQHAVQRLVEHLPEHLAQRLVENPVESLPENLAEHLPEGLPERLPERLVQHPPERTPLDGRSPGMSRIFIRLQRRSTQNRLYLEGDGLKNSVASISAFMLILRELGHV